MISAELNYEFIDPEKYLNAEEFKIVEDFLKCTKRKSIGWHYIIDLIWLFRKAKNWQRRYKVLDAGGGIGPTQFMLAEMGFDVVNIDLISRIPSSAFKKRYKCETKKLQSYKETQYKYFIQPKNSAIKNYIKKTPIHRFLKWRKQPSFFYNRACEKWKMRHKIDVPVGRIEWITGNLCDIPEIQDNTFDAVVSLSALEHIPLESISKALTEISRVLKANGDWAVTTSGTDRSEGWFHEPSQGWCFSEDDFKRIFKAEVTRKCVPSVILKKYKDCNYLKEHLADFYKKSGKFGMPWGIWDPKYIPVGISKN